LPGKLNQISATTSTTTFSTLSAEAVQKRVVSRLADDVLIYFAPSSPSASMRLLGWIRL
jgi:hypothetical protein